MTGHLFTVDPEARTVAGILLPYGELSRLSASGAEPIAYDGPQDITLPRDPDVVTLNDEHNQWQPLGRATVLEHRPPQGVYAEFRIARTDEGDAYLANPDRKRRLSPEIRDLVRRGAKGVGGVITGAAVTVQGAWEGAHLFAVGDITEAPEDTPDNPGHVNDVATPETPPASTTTNPEEDTAVTTPTIVPDNAPAAVATPRLGDMFAAISTGDPDALRPFARMGDAFALATVQHSGPSGATIAADTATPGALGELWARRPYQRRFVPLATPKALTNYTMQGWRWVTEPVVGDYTGNTAEVPSAAVDTEPVTVTAARLAGGHRLDRRYEDFNDQGVIASFLDKQIESYARVSDARCLTAMVAGATATAAGTVPTGVAKGLAAIVDGALGVIATENRPAWSIVSPELWRDIVLMKSDDKLEFLNAGFGLEEGDFAAFKILPGNVGTGKVITGAREAFEFYELSGVPIRVQGVQPGNGATDVAVFGYYASLVTNAAALRAVTVS